MKFLTSLLIMVLLMGFTSSAIAVDTSNLSKKQKALLDQQIANFNLENVTQKPVQAVEDVLSNPELLNQYATMGANIASGIGAAAKELNVGINEFLSSPAGTLVSFLLIYHFIGAELIGMIALFLFVLPITMWGFRRAIRFTRLESIDYDENGKARDVYTTEISSDQTAALAWIWVVYIIATIIELLLFLP